MRALNRRAHSVTELRRKLAERALVAADVEPLLARLTAQGWLDDRRFASGFAHYAVSNRRWGRYRIAHELRRRGLAQEWIAAALAEVFPSEENERALVRKRLDRRLRGKRPPYPQRLLRSLYAGLLRAGFSTTIVRDELFRRARETVPEDWPAGDEG
ncbi:MAG: regulatory protein RecX, partial [Terriglobia bacterium]